MLFHPAKKQLPTHLCVGVRKGATSWIWKQLQGHPDISVPVDKEVYFFNHFYDRGLNWYREQFQSRPVVLDMTPDYFEARCAERIRKDIPDAKIFGSLRNPAERAFSHWKFGRFIEALDPQISFRDVWEQDWRLIRTRGLYDQHLAAYRNLFPPENLMFLLYDDLEKNPLEFATKIFNYLGVPQQKSPYFDSKWMPGQEHLWGKTDQTLPREESYKRFNQHLILTPEDADMMLQYYADSIKSLEVMLGRSLENWLQPCTTAK